MRTDPHQLFQTHPSTSRKELRETEAAQRIQIDRALREQERNNFGMTAKEQTHDSYTRNQNFQKEALQFTKIPGSFRKNIILRRVF